MQRRSEGPLIDPAIVFPSMEVFEHPKKLPTTKSVIGVVKYLTERKFSEKVAIQEVSKLVFAKWYHDTIYCVSVRSINRKVSQAWRTFFEGRKRYASKQEGIALENYKSLVKEAEKTFNVRAEDFSK